MSPARGGPPCVAFETSTRRPSLAVRTAEGLIHARELRGERPHASDLVPTLDALFRELALRPGALEALVVGTGPGSYTGLRVGIASALGLARGTGAALLGVPSGEALAFERLLPGERGALLLDARQGELYFALYERTPDDVLTLDGPRVVRPEGLVLPSTGPIFGDGTVADAARLDAAARARLDALAIPGAAALLELGRLRLARGGPQDPAAVRPLYLRPFAARERKR